MEFYSFKKIFLFRQKKEGKITAQKHKNNKKTKMNKEICNSITVNRSYHKEEIYFSKKVIDISQGIKIYKILKYSIKLIIV